MYGIGRKQNPKESPLHIKKRNWIISNRLSVIQIQHRQTVLGHSVYSLLVLERQLYKRVLITALPFIHHMLTDKYMTKNKASKNVIIYMYMYHSFGL